MEQITQIIKDYINLPLECDGLTKVLSYLLSENNIPHKVCIGNISNKDNSIFHMWIVLDNNMYLDYRAQMWLGTDNSVPNGIFNPDDYPDVTYTCDNKIDLNVTEFIFRILTM